MSLRLVRVCELIKRELGSIIGREMRFSATLVSVRAVDITPDLKQAHVFISAIGTDRQKNEAILGLTANRQHLQHELSRRVILKYTPHLHFQLDESIERGTRVLSLLDEIAPTLPEEEIPGEEVSHAEAVQGGNRPEGEDVGKEEVLDEDWEGEEGEDDSNGPGRMKGKRGKSR